MINFTQHPHQRLMKVPRWYIELKGLMHSNKLVLKKIEIYDKTIVKIGKINKNRQQDLLELPLAQPLVALDDDQALGVLLFVSSLHASLCLYM